MNIESIICVIVINGICAGFNFRGCLIEEEPSWLKLFCLCGGIFSLSICIIFSVLLAGK